MKRILLLFTLLFTTAFGCPSETLLLVLDRFGICHDGSWESIQQETEKAWLPGRHVERWEIESIEGCTDEESYALFTPLGMTQSIYASDCYYTYALVLGATESVVKQRFLFLKDEWNRGVRFNQIVVLTGDRPLADFERSDAKNETEMMKLVFRELDLPKVWENMVVFIDTPRPEGLRRPHTHHTFEEWLKTNPPPGSKLLVSNQPFAYRQGAIARNYLTCVTPIGVGFTVEELKGRTHVLLAELAQWIKVEHETGTINNSPYLSSSH